MQSVYGVELFGFSSHEELIGKLNVSLVSEEHGEKIRQADEHVLNTGQRISFIESAVIRSRKMFFASSKEPMFNQNGDLIGVIGCSIDKTETYSAILETINNTGIMAGTVSHDIQNNIHLFCLYSEKAQRILQQLNETGLFKNVKIP